MTFLLGFWLGLALGIGGSWLYDHPDKRTELLDKIKVMFRK